MVRVLLIFIACLGAFLFAVMASIAAESPLPDGPNRDLVELVCSKCHTTDRILSKRMTKAEWKEEVAEMLQEEDDVSEEEKDQIIEYLAKTFPASTGDKNAASKIAAAPFSSRAPQKVKAVSLVRGPSHGR